MGIFDIFRKVTFIKLKSKAQLVTSHDTSRKIQIDIANVRGALHELEKSLRALESITNRTNISDNDIGVFLKHEKSAVEQINKLSALSAGIMSSASAIFSGQASNFGKLMNFNSTLVSKYKPSMPANPKNVQQAIQDYQAKVARVQSIVDMNKSFQSSMESIRSNLKSHSKLLLERRGFIPGK